VTCGFVASWKSRRPASAAKEYGCGSGRVAVSAAEKRGAAAEKAARRSRRETDPSNALSTKAKRPAASTATPEGPAPTAKLPTTRSSGEVAVVSSTATSAVERSATSRYRSPNAASAEGPLKARG